MKRYVSADENYNLVVDDRYIGKYLNQIVRNIANYAYNNAPLYDDDPRSDYFVENICEDSEVEKCKYLLKDAIMDAIDRQLRSY